MLYQKHLVPVLSLAGCYHLMQVRWVDQTQYPMIVVASLSAVPQSCRTPLPNQYLDCMLLAVYTHTYTHTGLVLRIGAGSKLVASNRADSSFCRVLT